MWQQQYVLTAIRPRPIIVSIGRKSLGHKISITFAIESLGPRYKDPIAIALSNNGCVLSRKTNVERCKTGNVGMKRTKNICKHSSRKREVIEVASIAAVTLEDWLFISYQNMGPKTFGSILS